MLYHLLFPLREIFSPLNIFKYITFRSGCAILTSMAISYLVGPVFIRILKRLNVCQQIRDDGPPAHLVKVGTPTMGGLMIGVSICISTLLWVRLDIYFTWMLLAAVVVLGGIGFADDFLKLSHRNAKGIPASAKLIGQTALAACIAFLIAWNPPNLDFVTSINIPYLKDVYIDLSWVYFAFAMLVIVGSSNAVNLTDGQDGLAIGGIIFVAATYWIFAYVAGNIKFAGYLRIIYVPGAGEIAVFLAALVGAAAGFLWYNAYPAEIFMGDTGSLLLGGSIGIVAVLIRQEILLVIVGGIFVVEVLSVVLQVVSFKTRKKRIFRMAPLHHHFEVGGMTEPKITVRFWIIAMILALISLASLKVR